MNVSLESSENDPDILLAFKIISLAYTDWTFDWGALRVCFFLFFNEKKVKVFWINSFSLKLELFLINLDLYIKVDNFFNNE